MTQAPKPQWRSRSVVVFIALIAFVPFAIAWYYAQHPELIEKTSNYGTLIQPVRQVELNQLLVAPQSPAPVLEELKGRWLLLQVEPDNCAAACRDSLHKTHQGWLMLNKDMLRVRRLLLTGASVPAGDLPVLVDDDALAVAGLTPAVVSTLTAAIGRSPGAGVVILLDPLGNLVLWYDAGFDPYKMVKDLKHLLKASQIG